MIYFSERFTTHPEDFKVYSTNKIREHFLIENLFIPGELVLVYSHFDRFIVGSAVPVEKEIFLENVPALKAAYFLERREIGIINIGGKGIVTADGNAYELECKEALYLGKGVQNVTFKSADVKQAAKFYINSAPAHCKYPNKKVCLAEAEVLEAGDMASSNQRRINKLIISSNVQSCQLQMGLTELKPGNVWNTMPPHVHSRRMEVYLYFEVPQNQAVCHFMGEPQETRHIWMQNEQAVISPNWSIHSAAGTSNYSFIWGMAGENLDYTDMDVVMPNQLK